MKYTTNYGLKKPDSTDHYNVDNFNDNMNIIDTKLKNLEKNDADVFDNTKTYAVGDYCIYDNVLYKCKDAITSVGEWDASKWDATSIAEEFAAIQTQLDGKVDNSFTASRVLGSDSTGKVAASSVTSTELGYLKGVTSKIQTQLDGKVTNSLTASRALATDANGKVVVSAVTDTELGYLDGVTSAIQTQLNNKLTNSFTASRALVSNSDGKATASSSVTVTELGYLNGVTSAIQDQLDGKQAKVSGAATTIASSNLTASRALVSNGSGKVAVSSTTSTELGYVKGVTSAIQTQLDSLKAKHQGGSLAAGETRTYTLENNGVYLHVANFGSEGCTILFICVFGNTQYWNSLNKNDIVSWTRSGLTFKVKANGSILVEGLIKLN